MKKFGIYFLAILAVGASFPLLARADISPVDGAPSESVISANCHFAQRLLSQIEHADAVVRVNRGGDYGDISDLLFAMNARLASNKIAAPKLTDLTAKFESGMDHFRGAYDKYDDALNSLIDEDCQESPNQFYADLVATRKLADDVNSATSSLDKIANDYKTELQNVTKGLR